MGSIWPLLCVLIVGSASLTAGGQLNALFPAPSIEVGISPQAVAIADFNSDGIADFVVANNSGFSTSGAVNILLGVGEGSFSARSTVPVGRYPIAVATSDFDNDGRIDLAVVNRGPNIGASTVSILLGAGDGGFPVRNDIPVGGLPWDVAVGDLNLDGHIDLAVVNNAHSSIGRSVSVLLGAGDGSFPIRHDFPVGAFPKSVVLGDVNNDGIPDLAVANEGSASISLLLGAGDGTFPPELRHDLPTDSSPVFAGLFDLNNDGNADLVVTYRNVNNRMRIYLGTGDGNFLTPTAVDVGEYAASVVAGDLDGDGNCDLAVVNEGNSGTSGLVNVLLGDGEGAFPSRYDLQAGMFPRKASLGDLNGDGIPDIIVANTNPATASLFWGASDGSFTSRRDISSSNRLPCLAAYDVNGDGHVDILAANDAFSGAVSVSLGAGDGSFSSRQNFAVGKYASAVAVGDFDGNGTPDLVATNRGSSSVSVLLGAGDGGFPTRVDSAVGPNPVSLAVADLNGDGKPDLAVATNGSASQRVSILLGSGDGGFSSRQDLALASAPGSIAAGDFDGDGHIDLAIANANRISMLLGNGSGEFSIPQDIVIPLNAYFVASRDINNDGVLDLVVANYSSSVHRVSVLLGAGDGSFPTRQDYPTGERPSWVAIGDLNGDGIEDLAAANLNVCSATILLGLGDGTFATRQDFTVGYGPNSVVIADLNRDGQPEVITGNIGIGGYSVLDNQRVPPVACAGDANNDGEVNLNDIAAVLAFWLSDYRPNTGEGDADGNGLVNFEDITAALSSWLNSCQ